MIIEHGNPTSHLNEAVCISHNTNTFVLVLCEMNLTILHLVNKTGILKHSMATGQGERKL